jgi:hypothetical protein
MKRIAQLLVLAATVAMAACLQRDTASTMYLRQDGSFDWVILEQNVRSDERTEASRLSEEARYVDGVSRGNTEIVDGLLALGAEDVDVRWLRSRRPYAVIVDARFDSLAEVFDRALAPCGVPYESRITESDGVVTWTFRADVGLDGEGIESNAGEDCGNQLDGLEDAFEHLRIILESGTFTAAKGFALQGTTAAAIDEAGMEESVKTTGTVELSLSWR